jgi:MoaA/NifB/PqqE/SkfB family radical SAM enzyme
MIHLQPAKLWFVGESERVVEQVARICRECPAANIGINPSLDGIGDEHTVGWGITPHPKDYHEIADFLSQQTRQTSAKGIARFTQAFRAHYYQLAKRVLHEWDQVIPCYAGWASAHIAPNGDLWSCCICAESVGNLRQHNYDITPLWRSQAMQQLRSSIKCKKCACSMPNANYANMLLHQPWSRYWPM